MNSPFRSSRTIFPGTLFLAAAVAGPALAAEEWTVLPDQSRIGFVAYQSGQPVEGSFREFAAEIVFDPEDVDGSRVEVEIDTASITTGHGDRDATLRSSSLFDVERWPTARFVSDELVHNGGEVYEAHGELTIRDVTMEVVLPFELAVGEHPDQAGTLLAEAAGELTISRLEFGVGQGDFESTSTVGDEVVIRIEIEATRPG